MLYICRDQGLGFRVLIYLPDRACNGWQGLDWRRPAALSNLRTLAEAAKVLTPPPFSSIVSFDHSTHTPASRSSRKAQGFRVWAVGIRGPAY